MGEAFKCQIQNVKFREIKVPFHFPPSIVRPMRELCGASEFNFGLVAEDIRFCDDDPSPMCPANHTYVNFDMKNRSAILYLQGDHSGCVKPPIDTKTKVAFQYMVLILKRNFCFDVNGRFDTT